MTQEPQKDSPTTRRGLLAGVGLAGLAGAITACGASGSSSSSRSTPASTSAPAPIGTVSATASGTASGPTSGALATTSEIPIGGGMIFDDQQVVVTQPAAGEYKAFSAVCTHMGCLVNRISDGTIDCPCHGSQYSIKNGAVVTGPAPRPLPSEKIKVTGDNIYLE